MINIIKLSSFLVFCLGLSLSAYGELSVPRLTGPVVDQAQFIDASQEQALSELLRSLRRSGGPQIQVLTLKDLSGYSIEQASIKIVDRWKLGDEEKDDGVLLLVAQQERKIRIEVGQGLEGDLTDAYSKRIISEIMVPLFRAGNPDSGILLGVVNIIKKTAPEFPIEQALKGQSFRSVKKAKKEKSLASRVLSLLFFIFMIILFIRNPMLFFLLLSGGGGHRGGGFGGSSGGGWSGGGGGFSGGGASGGW